MQQSPTFGLGPSYVMIARMASFVALVAVAAAALQPADFLREELGEPLAFTYGWPAAADAHPALREALRTDMEAERTKALGYVEESRVDARENGLEFIPHYFAKTWQVAGSTPQLISLTASEETFAGGAHGNIHFDAMLWDLAAQRRVTAAQVLGEAAILGMTERYCAVLDAERTAQRGEPIHRDPEDPHTLCPPLAELVLAPKDEDGDGRFDTLDVLIAPYLAGPYVEGPYFAEVPFRAEDLAGVNADYRPAFEEGTAQPQE